MRFYKVILVLSAAIAAASCAGVAPKPSTPLETLKSYTLAIKKKDTTAMKLLLSDASLKMAEQQAREQNTTVDEIVKNETLFTGNQTRLDYRSEKTEGERATIEVKNSTGAWDTVPFVLEDGIWKIDKQAIANQMMQQNELDQKRLDDIINQGRQP
ncbi:MAG TPA: hypothetical protein VGC76_09715 [Pyrinomonadaceae bacterium]|jgi:hypothetical protein